MKKLDEAAEQAIDFLNTVMAADACSPELAHGVQVQVDVAAALIEGRIMHCDHEEPEWKTRDDDDD